MLSITGYKITIYKPKKRYSKIEREIFFSLTKDFERNNNRFVIPDN